MRARRRAHSVPGQTIPKFGGQMAGAASTAPGVRSRQGAYLTMPPAVGLGTLRRLAALEPDCVPVLSVYLALAESAPAACEAELLFLIGELPPTFRLSTIGRVRQTLCKLPAFAHGTRAVALFFAADGSELGLVPLPERVATTAVCAAQPWLEPLLAMCGCGERRDVSLERPRRVRQPAPVLTPDVLGDHLEAIACR